MYDYYKSYADVPAEVRDRIPPNLRNTASEQEVIRATANAMRASGVIAEELRLIRAQTEAMMAWQDDIGKFSERHHVMAGLFTRIARAVEKIANIDTESDMS